MAEYRDKPTHDLKAQTLIDLIWAVWCTTFDDKILELCSQEMQTASQTSFLWHRPCRTAQRGWAPSVAPSPLHAQAVQFAQLLARSSALAVQS